MFSHFDTIPACDTHTDGHAMMLLPTQSRSTRVKTNKLDF